MTHEEIQDQEIIAGFERLQNYLRQNGIESPVIRESFKETANSCEVVPPGNTTATYEFQTEDRKVYRITFRRPTGLVRWSEASRQFNPNNWAEIISLEPK